MFVGFLIMQIKQYLRILYKWYYFFPVSINASYVQEFAAMIFLTLVQPNKDLFAKQNEKRAFQFLLIFGMLEK